MSANTNHPSREEIRKARREGFKDSVSHMPLEKRQRMAGAYIPQDTRRERNVGSFYQTIRGNG